jgi:hypothetical protein
MIAPHIKCRLNLEQFLQKCVRFCEKNMRQNIDLEHAFDSIKSKRAREQFLRKWEPVSRQELRQNIDLEHAFDSIKSKRAREQQPSIFVLEQNWFSGSSE